MRAGDAERMAMSKDSFRMERDSMGELKVPADALWGAQTQRSLHHFRISTERMPPDLVRALLVRVGKGQGNAAQRQDAPARRVVVSERGNFPTDLYIAETLAKEFLIDGKSVRTGVTTGISIFPHNGADAASLLANAGAALFRAKAKSRGSIRMAVLASLIASLYFFSKFHNIARLL